MFKLFLVLLGLCQIAYSKFYYWEATWVRAAPDGFSRPVIGINGKWPPPTLEAEVGETITITLNNKLGNQSTSLHWHGIRQFGTGQMDGATGTTQCPIPPGALFTYSFKVDEVGTYWYHSHNMGQFPDGLRAPLIVRDPKQKYPVKIEKEYTLTLSDWYHKQMPELIKYYQSQANTAGVEPIPDSILINDGAPVDYKIEPGKTYLFRVLNIGSFPSFFLNFKDHDMQIVGLDGVPTLPATAKTVVVGAAMRYDVLITGKTNATSNFDIAALIDSSMFTGNFSGNPVGYAQLVYDPGFPKAPGRTPPVIQQTAFPPFDDITTKPEDGEKLLGPVTKQVVLDFGFTKINGIHRAVINNITYLNPKVPSLYTALSVGKENTMNPVVYGKNVNPIAVKFGDVVEVVLNNRDAKGHPWHLHGHKFQVVARSASNAVINGQLYDASTATLPAVPAKRDVIGVRDGGYTVIRFKADNPGTQLIHCHIEWHIEAGLSATFIEATDRLKNNIPLDHKLACLAAGMKTNGNAAGNTRNVLDLKGANTEVPLENNGATYSKEDNKWWNILLPRKPYSHFGPSEE